MRNGKVKYEIYKKIINLYIMTKKTKTSFSKKITCIVTVDIRFMLGT